MVQYNDDYNLMILNVITVSLLVCKLPDENIQ